MTSSVLRRLLVAAVCVGVTAAVGRAQADPPPEGRKAVMRFDALDGDVLALWKAENRPVTRTKLTDAVREVAVDPGAGCLVLVREGSAPVRAPIVLEAGETHEVELPDWMPGVRVNGHIADETGGPIAGFAAVSEVRVPTTPPGDGEDPAEDLCEQALVEGEVQRALTDDSGVFSLGPVGPGAYILSVTSTDRETLVRELVLASGSPTLDVGKLPLRLVSELAVSFDLSEVPEEPPFAMEVFRENTAGFVSQRDAWIEATRLEVADDRPIAVRLHPGFHQIRFSKEDSDVYYVETIELSPGINSLVLRPRAILVGGRVIDKAGGIKDATVKIVCSGVVRETTSSEDGSFELPVWTPGQCAVAAKTPDGGKFLRTLDLTTHQLGDSVEVVLEIPQSRVAGLVLDADSGEEIPEAEVTLVQTVSGGSSQYSTVTRTDEHGHFEFKGVRDDNESTAIAASADGYIRSQQRIFVDDRLVDDLVVELQRAERITGLVVGPTGEPIGGAMVGCCAPDFSSRFSQETQTDSRGEFSLDVPAGTAVFAAASGYSVGWARTGGPDDRVAIPLSARGAPIQLLVVSSDGDPVPGMVVLFGSDGVGIMPYGLLALDAVLNRESVRTDPSGTLVSSALPYGLYRVFVLTSVGPLEAGALAVPSFGEVKVHVPEG